MLADYSTIEVVFALLLFMAMLTGGILAGIGIAMLTFGPLRTIPTIPELSAMDDEFRREA